MISLSGWCRSAHYRLLELLRNALLDALGIADPGSYLPHMTLLYDPRVVDEILLTAPVKWVAEEFVLVRSLHGLTEYEILGRWPLMSRVQYLARTDRRLDRDSSPTCSYVIRQL